MTQETPTLDSAAVGEEQDAPVEAIAETTSTVKIRVLVVDDHTILRVGLRMMLNAQPDIEVVGEASDGNQAVSEALRLIPDVILMDIAMPDCNGI